MQREDYFFEQVEHYTKQRMLVLVIYDIVENKQRTKFTKFLLGYGNRVQKSAFEANLTKQQYDKLVKEIPKFCSEVDSIRVYRIIGKSHILSWGKSVDFDEDEIILI